MAILKKQNAPTLPVPQEKVLEVPELGGEVVIRPLRLSDRLRVTHDSGERTFSYVAALLGELVVDADGQPLYTPEQWEAWGGVNIEAVMRIFDEVWKMSGLGPQAQEDAQKKLKAQNSG